jgi:DNA-directed RNA polymerase subunit RPC12/RpoP
MVETECLACWKPLNIPKDIIPKNIETDDYDGQVVCKECKSLLHVKLVKGKLQKYKIVAEFKLRRKPIEVVEVRLPPETKES